MDAKKLWFVPVLAASLAGCALMGIGGTGAMDFSASPSVPAAEGGARFSATKNDNTQIDLWVKHLAHPDKLTPPSGYYVVWLRSKKNMVPQNMGALTLGDDLSGSLKTETPLHSFELIITAEASGEAQTPTGPALLWGRF